IADLLKRTVNLIQCHADDRRCLALGGSHLADLQHEQAVAAQSAVTEATNELLKKNAETLHTGAVEIAKESERAIVDLETVRYTNEQLMATLDEVLAIQEEGHAKRVEAEAALAKIENELREKLLSMTKSGQNSGLVEEVKA
ncbi:MAG: toxic anion resistance protein, partial [Firmicutes bacterium]|nr:toxic anion resistance protein [Bacillota bacterium]